MRSLSMVTQLARLDLGFQPRQSGCRQPTSSHGSDRLPVFCCEICALRGVPCCPLLQPGRCPCSVFLYIPHIASFVLSSADTLVSRKPSTPVLHPQELEGRKEEISPERRVQAQSRGEDERRGSALGLYNSLPHPTCACC